MTEGRHAKYSMPFQNITMVSDNMVYNCNDKAVVVSVMCIEQADSKMQEMKEKIFGSAKCEGKEAEVKGGEAKRQSIRILRMMIFR